ncbi:MAG: GlsB/YeaQ/YmgE family stress response membrane protein [Chthoniobacterales bacterium]
MTISGILVICLIGLVVGAIAKLLMPGRDPGGCIVTMLLGIAGAWLGSFLGQAAGIYPQSGFGRFIAALIGAMILLLIYRLIFGKRS